MTDSDNKSLGLTTNNTNSNLSGLSSASKMNKSKNKNKIPRGATGAMPSKSGINPTNKSKTIIGFKDSKPNIDEKNNINKPGIIRNICIPIYIQYIMHNYFTL